MITGFHSGWYLLYTKPKHEKKVYRRLIEKKIDSLLPTKRVIRVWHDRKKYIDEPLFPSYVFINLKDRQNYYDGADIDGSLHYVKTGKEMARVSDEIIENIRLLTEQNSDLEICGQQFLPGRKLVINKGALTGLSCEVIQVNGKKKLLVRVDLLQRNILVTLPEDFLMSI